MKKIFFILIAAVLVLASPLLAKAADISQDLDQVAADTIAQVDNEIEVTAQDLGNVNTGWLAGLWRNVKLIVTRDPVKKANLELEKADVQMIKLKELVQQKKNDPKFEKRMEKAQQKHKKAMERVKNYLEKAGEKNPHNPKLDKFLDIYTDHALKQEQILENMENKVPPKVRQLIKTRREEHLKRFGEVMNKLQNKEQFKHRIENILTDDKIKIQHRIMNTRILERLEEVNPELKEKIEAAKEEGHQLWSELKTKNDEIIKQRQQLIEDVRKDIEANKDKLIDNPEARKELRDKYQERVKNLREEHRGLKKEAQEKAEKFKEEHQDDLKKIRDNLKEHRQTSGPIRAGLKVNTVQ